jgi:NADPH2:quinone reductase
MALAQVNELYYVQKGDTILVHTVAGGVGLLLAQMSNAQGPPLARLSAQPLPQKAALAKAHGTDHVILYKKENTVDCMLELTDGQGVNIIYNGIGKAMCVTCVISSASILCATGSTTTWTSR